MRWLKLVWNGLAIAAILFLVWSVYQAFQQISAPTTVTTTTVGPQIIEAVRRVNKQIFIEHYAGVEVRHLDAPDGWAAFLRNLGVRQEFLVLIRGRVPAGIDLSQLRDEDIWVSSDGRRVQVTLPPPEVFYEQVTLDLANSRIIENTDFCPGFICPQSSLESFFQSVDAEAKSALVEAAIEAGILAQAARDAEAYYTQLLNSLGIAEVRVIVRGYSAP
ncbi:DUF4230 domain-containing protein [Chloroflexus sp.]|uniref:DUF4230 domain-containing protein n=1 Tax=Chloroflexus sp. TaxID=1904827 RepID=UPI00262E9BF0|nr:DUF4230 domain-containing protein [uncultured Chloroflexus sp.]